MRGEITTNTVEGFFGQVRRSITGTHHYIANKHAQRYLSEFDFHYEHPLEVQTDAQRMADLFKQVEGRLLYKALTGKA